MGGKGKRPVWRPGKGVWLLPWLALLVAVGLVGCQAIRGVGPDDPALRALGEASMKVMDEKMRNPLAMGPGIAGSVLGKPFVLAEERQGTASEVTLGLARALGYGLVVKNARAAALVVAVKPGDGSQSVFWLIRELNRPLGESQAIIWVDTVNKRLVLSASEVAP